jgi:hypothetical protein
MQLEAVDVCSKYPVEEKTSYPYLLASLVL